MAYARTIGFRIVRRGLPLLFVVVLFHPHIIFLALNHPWSLTCLGLLSRALPQLAEFCLISCSHALALSKGPGGAKFH